jgi:hypothetical protein
VGLDSEFQQWMLETGNKNIFPNIGGTGSNAMVLMEHYGRRRHERYGYVSGLREDDPPNLVLMYLKERTAYTWHADSDHTIFSHRRWMVLSPQFIQQRTSTYPEGGELLETPEFEKRLRATLEFLKTNQRTNWQTVTEEQMAFLESVKN